MDKKYGLQLRVKPQQKQHPKKPFSRPPLPKSALGFGDDDDEDDVEREISRQSYKNKSLKDVEQQHKKALEEDPSAFDYDGVYDEMKQKVIRPIMNDRQERKPKYIQALIEKAKQREREHEIVYERKIAKERSKDDHLYAEKDKFITSAYKKKLAEQAKWMEEERLRELREERDDVTKKTDITDFYYNLSKNVAYGGREGDLRKAGEPCEEPATELQETIPSSSNALPESSKVIERQESRDSPSLTELPEETEAKIVPDPSEQDKAVHKPSLTEQPKGDHHKRNQDALAAAKERFLARKKAK